MSDITWNPRIVGVPKIAWFTLYDDRVDSYEIGVVTEWSDGSTQEINMSLDAFGGLDGRPGRPPFMHEGVACRFTSGEKEKLYHWLSKEVHVVISQYGFTPENPLKRAVTYYVPGYMQKSCAEKSIGGIVYAEQFLSQDV
jgi:hypothetical protein